MDLPADIAALVQHDLPANARAEYEAVCNRQEASTAAVTEAERALADAQARQGRLAAAAAQGEQVNPKDVHAAARVVRDAEAHLQFAHTTLSEVAVVWRQAHDALTASFAEAYRPVMERGIELRIEAAARVDRARAELAHAEADYHLASDVIQHAMTRGLRLPHWFGNGGIGRECRGEAAEREMWRRPAPATTEAATP